MYALICRVGGEELIKQCDGILEVKRVTKLSDLKKMLSSKTLEGVLLESSMGIKNAINQRIPDVPIMEYERFSIEDTLAWDAMQRETAMAFVKPLVQPTLQEMRHQIQSTKKKTPVYMLEGPKGGVGRSTIGAHMAYYGALKGKRIAIIDLDPNGNIATMLGLLDTVDTRGWRGASVDQAVRDHVCLIHNSGLHVFPSPQDKDVVFQTSDDALYLLKLCIEEMDAVFLDMPQGWTPLHTDVLPYVDKLIMVVTPSIDRLDRVREHAEKLQFAELPAESISAVINMSKKRSDKKALNQYLLPYKASLVLPYDQEIEQKGGLAGRRFIRSSKVWWDEMYGFNQGTKNVKKRKWFFW